MANVKTKFIFVTGGVVSSLGKGLASASIGALMESRGLSVTLSLVLVLYPLPVSYLTLIHPQRKSTLRVGAHPGFERHRGPFLPVVR